MTKTDRIPDDVADAVAHLNATSPRIHCGETLSARERLRLRGDVAVLTRWVGDDPERAQMIAEALG